MIGPVPESPRPVPSAWSEDNARAGRLPPRYGNSMRGRFEELVSPSLVPGARILDVGSGRDPSFSREELPPHARYVGLDVSASELEQAPLDAYDEIVVSDVARRVPALELAFDVLVSWQVLEHVRPLGIALENMRSYLRPGGRMVAVFSGSYSAFGLINRLLPDRLGRRIAARALRIDQEHVFPAHYDHCHERALTRLLSSWSMVEIEPMYRGAVYFRSFPPLLRAYLAYENWTVRADHGNLATHYVLVAER
jgi:SAM-dependent methyltransferase